MMYQQRTQLGTIRTHRRYAHRRTWFSPSRHTPYKHLTQEQIPLIVTSGPASAPH